MNWSWWYSQILHNNVDGHPIFNGLHCIFQRYIIPLEFLNFCFWVSFEDIIFVMHNGFELGWVGLGWNVTLNVSSNNLFGALLNMKSIGSWEYTWIKWIGGLNLLLGGNGAMCLKMRLVKGVMHFFIAMEGLYKNGYESWVKWQRRCNFNV